ncbi:MAG: enolase C-terminal domain-like protein, partial [Candidatus Latescibacteria bacterium]|nr:enolase C-terminal domain-like protein [Candidatus Latescibacterota bacterium]
MNFDEIKKVADDVPESGFTVLKIDVDIDASGYRDLLEKQAVNIIMPDIPRCGGLSECRKVANMPAIYYIPFAPHNVSSPLGTHASAHVCAHGAQLPGAEIPLAAPVLLDH